MKLNQKVIAAITAVGISSSSATALAATNNKELQPVKPVNQNFSMNYEEYCQYMQKHTYVDISNSAYLAEYLKEHTKNCNDPICKEGYEIYFQNQENNKNIEPPKQEKPKEYQYDLQKPNDEQQNPIYDQNQYPNNPNMNKEYEYGYEEIKIDTDQTYYKFSKTTKGRTIYAYSPTKSLSSYNIDAFDDWEYVGICDEDDYALNSVFYEEYYNSTLSTSNAKKIVNKAGLYVWSYETVYGTRYCVSKVKSVTSINKLLAEYDIDGFTYVGTYSSDYIQTEIKTLNAAVNDLTNSYYNYNNYYMKPNMYVYKK